MLYRKPDIVDILKAALIRWLGRVVRMKDSRVAKAMMDGLPRGKRRIRGRPRAR